MRHFFSLNKKFLVPPIKIFYLKAYLLFYSLGYPPKISCLRNLTYSVIYLFYALLLSKNFLILLCPIVKFFRGISYQASRILLITKNLWWSFGPPPTLTPDRGGLDVRAPQHPGIDSLLFLKAARLLGTDPSE